MLSDVCAVESDVISDSQRLPTNVLGVHPGLLDGYNKWSQGSIVKGGQLNNVLLKYLRKNAALVADTVSAGGS